MVLNCGTCGINAYWFWQCIHSSRRMYRIIVAYIPKVQPALAAGIGPVREVFPVFVRPARDKLQSAHDPAVAYVHKVKQGASSAVFNHPHGVGCPFAVHGPRSLVQCNKSITKLRYGIKTRL